MKIALAQLNYTIGDFEGNTLKIIKSIDKARTEGAGLIVFSELAVCGYPPDDLLDYPHFIAKCETALQKIAAATQGITAIVGCPVTNAHPKGRRLYNAACILTNGEHRDTIYKTLLPTYDVFSEARYFQSNDVFKTIEIGGVKTAVTICEDLWDEMDFFSYTEDPLKNLSALQPELIINISASPFNEGKLEQRLDILSHQSANFKLPMVYVNQVGAHTDLIFDGSSLYINRDGKVVYQCATFEEEFVIIDTSTTQASTSVAVPRIEQLHKALIFGLKDYFTKMNFSKVVLGSSGGIDSAVVQALASEAIGAENVTAVLMPSQYSSGGSVTDAQALSENLGNPYFIVPIKDAYDSFDSALQPLFNNLPADVTEENLQARIRGVLLMAYSNKKGHILLNTSNKSEMAVGYSTLYGDMCGSLSVIGDVYKTDVYALANYINRSKEIIPSDIINKAPSAELRPDQKDSDSLPPYDVLDAILKCYIEGVEDKVAIVNRGFDEATVTRVLQLVNRNEFKRYQAPPILRVTAKAFGRGRLIPLVARF
ncbi:MAG: NAD+ synthase [Bacteroidota bacterium]